MMMHDDDDKVGYRRVKEMVGVSVVNDNGGHR